MIKKEQSKNLRFPKLAAVLPNAVVLEGPRIKTEASKMDIRIS